MTQVPRIVAAAAATLAALALTSATAHAAPAGSPVRSPAAVPAPAAAAAPHPGTVSAVTDRLAARLARDLADRSLRSRVDAAAARGPADLLALAPGTRLDRQARSANRAVLRLKGLPASSGSLLRLRLANPQAAASLRRGAVPVVAAEPSDDTPASITAYDPQGGTVALDPAKAPQRPVLVVEVDVAKALPLGLELMRRTLAGHGVGAAAPRTARALDAGGYWATEVDAVRLNDDEEPWIKGAAEIYSIVGGFGLDGKPTVDIVQMPYLDYDGVTYYPNQLLVHFSAYKYNLADVVMMEDDGDTNYESLAQAIADALLTITDNGTYVPLVDAILAAIPSSWWTDDPDYVDSWYTLSTTSSGRLYGAAGNGWMDVSPYWVSEL